MPSEEINRELAESVNRSIREPLETAQEEVIQVVLMAIVSRGVSISVIIEAIANICDERGYKKPVGLLERAIEMLKEDES